LEALGRHAEAEEAFADLLDKHPASGEAQLARRRAAPAGPLPASRPAAAPAKEADRATTR
ncbi:MAG: hypothetical protein ACK4N5_12875, partial [Myxococcales bacterium]